MLNKLSRGKMETNETKQWMSYKEIVFHIFECCNSVEIEREEKEIMGQGFHNCYEHLAQDLWLQFSYFFKFWVTAGLVSTGLSVTKMTKPTFSFPKAYGDEITRLLLHKKQNSAGYVAAPGRKYGLRCLPFSQPGCFYQHRGSL